jgi:oligopeptide transport system ATP-binding protein
MSDTAEVLRVERLCKHFPVKSGILKSTTGWVKAVNEVSFSARRGETLGLVGESGCGKSTTGRCILRLLEPTSGRILFSGTDVGSLAPKELRNIRKRLQMIFQDPYASLNPRMSVAQNVGEPLLIHGLVKTRKERDEKVSALLESVGLNPDYIHRFPFEFSGGQHQRIGIARALAVEPELIIADEPVSALDVSVQAQIINLLQDLREKFGLTYIFIAHDLSVVKHISDRIAVMYLGSIVELAGKKTLFDNPLHPYTQSLLSAVPIPVPSQKKNRIVLQGDIPSSLNLPNGCIFHTRCPKAMDICSEVVPEVTEKESGHWVSCLLYS